MGISQAKPHHFAAFTSLFVGLSFLFEHYMLVSPALIGPVALMSWVPGPLSPIQVWGLLFVVGSFCILLSWNIVMRALFLCCGMASWAIFAATSFYQSILGPQSATTGSLLGIVLTGLVLTFFLAIRHVSQDFTRWDKRARIDA